jgi:hypothetical protein
MWVNINLQYGLGVDEPSLRRAMELEDTDVDVPIPLRASAINVLVLAWTGRLDEARAEMMAVRRRCNERGAESDMMAVTGNR